MDASEDLSVEMYWHCQNGQDIHVFCLMVTNESVV